MAVKNPDFSGYATKASLKCSDGRTIAPNAFQDQDGQRVPLVWAHKRDEASNILGHAILENREDGVYCMGYFNQNPQAVSAKQLLEHGDIDSMSIYANDLVEKTKTVLHGAIREVSLVLAGANPGAKIDFVNIVHGDGEIVELDDEAIITTGLELEHAVATEDKPAEKTADSSTTDSSKSDSADNADEGETVEDVFNTLTDKQKQVVGVMVEAALESKEAPAEETSNTNSDDSKDATHSADTTTEDSLNHDQEGSNEMGIKKNVFEGDAGKTDAPTISHDQFTDIMNDAARLGSLKESFLSHAGDYGIDDIDILFPDAKTVTPTPEVIGRRTEWVAEVLGKTKHSPFSRIKSTAVDLTADEARAKGYVKGNLKKDEVIKLLKRVTTPTTIYKKQKLDRDDIVDITELNVIAWLKAEMRLMLDEELARAVLVGDGREPDDEDKINEDHIRPIAYDADMYAHGVNLTQAGPDNAADTIEAIVRARRYYKGTGTPTMYTTDEVLTDLILDKDTLGRRYYNTEAELAAALRVDKIVTVEPMEDTPDILAIIVNLADYTLGADAGGAVSMFDDFDIDYNQQKYLIETRCSGALTKPKSALVIRLAVPSGHVVVPTQPAYNSSTHVITIPSTTGVIYSINGVDKSAGALPAITETTEVEARPAATYAFPHGTDSDWTFVY